jgi:hypothetical protein
VAFSHHTYSTSLRTINVFAWLDFLNNPRPSSVGLIAGGAMATDCNESTGIRVFHSEVGPPKARGPSDEITEIEQELHRIFSSLLALAQEQQLSTVCQTFSRLKQDTEECLLSGCSPIFCPAFPINARNALSEFRLLLELKQRTSRLPIKELQTKSVELEKYLAYAEWDFKDSQAGFKNEAARLAGVYAMRVSQFVSQTSEQLSESIREQFRLLEDADRTERSVKMSSFVQARLQELLGNWQSPFEESSTELFQHAAIRFARHACELTTGIRSSAGSLFGCSAQSGDWCEEFAESDCFTCVRDRGPDCFLGGTQPQFSTVQFRKHLLRNTLRNASSDLLSYVSRAVEEHKGHLDKCCSDLIKRMTEQVSETKEGIRDVVETSSSRSECQRQSVFEQRVDAEGRNVVDTLRQHAEELEFLLCRWENIGDRASEVRVNAKETETGNANSHD